MTTTERIRFLEKRIARNRKEIADTINRISDENSLCDGAISNLVHLKADITELAVLKRIVDWGSNG